MSPACRPVGLRAGQELDICSGGGDRGVMELGHSGWVAGLQCGVEREDRVGQGAGRGLLASSPMFQYRTLRSMGILFYLIF